MSTQIIKIDKEGNLLCRHCEKPVNKSREEYELFEGMHWICFHYQFEHSDTDPDEPCHDPSCPWNRIKEKEMDDAIPFIALKDILGITILNQLRVIDNGLVLNEDEIKENLERQVTRIDPHGNAQINIFLKTQENEENGFRNAIRASLRDGSFLRSLKGEAPLPNDTCKLNKPKNK